MITADGRSAIEVEIEHMRFTDLDTREPIFGLDYSDVPSEHTGVESPDTPSLFTRWIERIFGVGEPVTR
jgi:hypothetical protein